MIVVDSGFSRATGQAILGGLRKVTDKPVSMVINTHWHADHIFGNQVFRTAFAHAVSSQFAFFSSPRKWIDTLGRLAAVDAAALDRLFRRPAVESAFKEEG